MGTVMVTTDIAVDAAIITVGAEGVVIITDGTEAVVTVTGKPLLEGSVRDAPRFDERCVKRPEGAKRRPLRLSVGARVSPLSCPQRFTNLRQA